MNTNYHWLATEVNLPHDCVLWVLHHRQRHSIEEARRQCSDWDQARRIVLIDQEGQYSGEELEADPRLVLYDSVWVDHAQVRPWMYFFREVVHVDKFTQLSAKCKPWREKTADYLFDCLLGTMWPNKKFVQQRVDLCSFQYKFLQGSRQPHIGAVDQDWLYGGGYEIALPRIEFTAGQQVNIASYVPCEIYNQSWYSVVAESYRPRVFITEKIAKPIMAKRLFVVFGSRYTLKALKDLGFMTFDSVIDESYDSIMDDTDRWNAAWQQIEHLSQLDPHEVYHSIQQIVDHNHRNLVETDWHGLLVKSIQQQLTFV